MGQGEAYVNFICCRAGCADAQPANHADSTEELANYFAGAGAGEAPPAGGGSFLGGVSGVTAGEAGLPAAGDSVAGGCGVAGAAPPAAGLLPAGAASAAAGSGTGLSESVRR